MKERAWDVVLRNVTKRYGQEAPAVDDVSFEVAAGEFVSILGPSGSGKTTLLRMLAGFLEPTSGTIEIAGRPMQGVPPHDRPVNLVFQSYALFPHMSVFDNVAYGPRRKGAPKVKIAALVDEALALVGLESYQRRRPRQLSGGQQQRVALARALVNHPRVLLLDEPLAALDLKLRKQMQIELKRIQERVGITFIYVTHDQQEALVLSDRVAVMDRGRLAQIADPYVVYERPATAFVADFIGETNLIECEVTDATDECWNLRAGSFRFVAARGGAERCVSGAVLLSLRPERIRLAREAPAADNVLRGMVAGSVYLGTLMTCRIDVGESLQLTVATSDQRLVRSLARGDEVYVGWSASDGIVVEK